LSGVNFGFGSRQSFRDLLKQLFLFLKIYLYYLLHLRHLLMQFLF